MFKTTCNIKCIIIVEHVLRKKTCGFLILLWKIFIFSVDCTAALKNLACRYIYCGLLAEGFCLYICQSHKCLTSTSITYFLSHEFLGFTFSLTFPSSFPFLFCRSAFFYLLDIQVIFEHNFCFSVSYPFRKIAVSQFLAFSFLILLGNPFSFLIALYITYYENHNTF